MHVETLRWGVIVKDQNMQYGHDVEETQWFLVMGVVDYANECYER